MTELWVAFKTLTSTKSLLRNEVWTPICPLTQSSFLDTQYVNHRIWKYIVVLSCTGSLLEVHMCVVSGWKFLSVRDVLFMTSELWALRGHPFGLWLSQSHKDNSSFDLLVHLKIGLERGTSLVVDYLSN